MHNLGHLSIFSGTRYHRRTVMACAEYDVWLSRAFVRQKHCMRQRIDISVSLFMSGSTSIAECSLTCVLCPAWARLPACHYARRFRGGGATCVVVRAGWGEATGGAATRSSRWRP